MVKFEDGNRYFFAGASGSGKSTKLKEVLRDTGADKVLVVDPKGDYRHEKEYTIIDSNKTGWQGELVKLLKRRYGKPFKITVLASGRTASPERALIDCADIVMGMQQPYNDRLQDSGKIAFVVEECSFCYKSHAPRTADFEPMHSLIRTGRTFGIDLYAVTQAPATIGNDLRANATETYLFALMKGDRAGYDAVKKMMPKDAFSKYDAFGDYDFIHVTRDRWSQGRTKKS